MGADEFIAEIEEIFENNERFENDSIAPTLAEDDELIEEDAAKDGTTTLKQLTLAFTPAQKLQQAKWQEKVKQVKPHQRSQTAKSTAKVVKKKPAARLNS